MSGFADFDAFGAGSNAQKPAARTMHTPPMTMVPQRSSVSSSGPMLGLPPLCPTPGQTAAQLQLTPREQSYFDSLFLTCDGARTSGMVSGSAVKGLFTSSRLPKPTLAQIWTLADRSRRRSLDREEFYIACRLIALAQHNMPISYQALRMRSPNDVALPVFEGHALPSGQQQTTPMHSGMGGGGLPPMQPNVAPTMHKQAPLTSSGPGLGATPSAASSPAAASFPVSLGRSPSPGSGSSAPTPTHAASSSPSVDEWSISSSERSQYLSLFNQADADGDGFVGGREANLFFKQSGLDNATLKKIWLLSDVDRDNKLNPEEFAIAMHITLKVRKKHPLPPTLPASLDPRLKGSAAGTPTAAASAAATGVAASSTPSASHSRTASKSRLDLSLLPDVPSMPPPPLQPGTLQQQPTSQVHTPASVAALTPSADLMSGFDLPPSSASAASRKQSIDFGFGSSSIGGGSSQPQPQQPPTSSATSRRTSFASVSGLPPTQPTASTSNLSPKFGAQSSSSSSSFGFGIGNSPAASVSPGAVMTPSSSLLAFTASSSAAPAESHHQHRAAELIEATQALEDRTAHLASMNNQVDEGKKSIAQAEQRLADKKAALEEIEKQINEQQQVLDQQKSTLSSIEEQHHEVERKHEDAQRRLKDTQESLKSTEERLKATQESTATLKHETDDINNAIQVLEAKLAALNSSLKGVEDLKESQATILNARKEQHLRLLAEKNEVAEILQQSKRELMAMKEQSTLTKQSIESLKEGVKEMHEMLVETQDIVKQERANMARGSPMAYAAAGERPTSSHSPVVTSHKVGPAVLNAISAITGTASSGEKGATPSPPIAAYTSAPTSSSAMTSVASVSTSVKLSPPAVKSPFDEPDFDAHEEEEAKATSSSVPATTTTAKQPSIADTFNFGDDDDEYNIDDIQLPGLDKPTSISSTSSTAAPSATSPEIQASTSPATAEQKAPLIEEASSMIAPASSNTSPAIVPQPAPVPIPAPSPASSANAFGEDDDDWSSPSSNGPDPFAPVPTATATASASAPAPTREEDAFDAAFPPHEPTPPASEAAPAKPSSASPPAAAPNERAVASAVSPASTSSLQSPPPPAAPTFPSALEGTGVPDTFASVSNEGVEGAGSGEGEMDDPWGDDADPFGPGSSVAAAGSGTDTCTGTGSGSGLEVDPFGESGDDPFGDAPSAGSQEASDPWVVSPAVRKTNDGENDHGATSKATASAFDDDFGSGEFADFGSPEATAATATTTGTSTKQTAAPTTPPPAQPPSQGPAPPSAAKPAATTTTAAPLSTQQSSATSAFDAAMADDWASFD